MDFQIIRKLPLLFCDIAYIITLNNLTQTYYSINYVIYEHIHKIDLKTVIIGVTNIIYILDM